MLPAASSAFHSSPRCCCCLRPTANPTGKSYPASRAHFLTAKKSKAKLSDISSPPARLSLFPPAGDTHTRRGIAILKAPLPTKYTALACVLFPGAQVVAAYSRLFSLIRSCVCVCTLQAQVRLKSVSLCVYYVSRENAFVSLVQGYKVYSRVRITRRFACA